MSQHAVPSSPSALPARAGPHVLHCLADWGVPSERFVVDLVSSAQRTRPVVACGRIHREGSAAPGAGFPVTQLGPLVSHLPFAARRPAIRALLTGLALRHRADLLHAHFGYWGAHAAVAAHRVRRPWIVSLHGYDVLVKGASDAELHLVRSADAVVVPSQFLGNAAIARGFPAERVHVIPSGIDVDRYRYRPRTSRTDGTVHVSFAGRFVAKKGVLDAVNAMAAARTAIPDTVFVFRFVGFGPQEEELRSALARLSVPAEVVDGRGPGSLQGVLDDTDILLTPSTTASDGDAESLGLVNIEAQASGVPVITTAHGGIPEAVAHDGAVLVPEGDARALAGALTDLARAPERWPAMGRAGSDHVRLRFRLADRARDVEDLYLAVIESSQRRRNRP